MQALTTLMLAKMAWLMSIALWVAIILDDIMPMSETKCVDIMEHVNVHKGVSTFMFDYNATYSGDIVVNIKTAPNASYTPRLNVLISSGWGDYYKYTSDIKQGVDIILVGTTELTLISRKVLLDGIHFQFKLQYTQDNYGSLIDTLEGTICYAFK